MVGKMIHIDSVGNDFIISREGFVNVSKSGGRYCDATMKAPVPTLDNGVGEGVKALVAVGSVESANIDRFGELQHAKGKDGGHWFMKVDYVERFPAQQVAYLGEKPPRQAYPGDGAAAGQGHRPAQWNEPLNVWYLTGGGVRSQHLHLVPQPSQLPGQLPNMGRDPTGPGKIVGTHHGDFHSVTPRLEAGPILPKQTA